MHITPFGEKHFNLYNLLAISMAECLAANKILYCIVLLFALHFRLLIKVVNPCFILGYNLLNKISGKIFLARQEIPKNIELSPSLIIIKIHGTHLAETFDIPKISVKIDCSALKPMPTLLAMLRWSRLLSHITRMCMTCTFTSAVTSFGAARPSINFNTFSPPLKLCCLFFLLC